MIEYNNSFIIINYLVIKLYYYIIVFIILDMFAKIMENITSMFHFDTGSKM